MGCGFARFAVPDTRPDDRIGILWNGKLRDARGLVLDLGIEFLHGRIYVYDGVALGWLAPSHYDGPLDRKGTGLNSSHDKSEYADCCLKKKKKK